MSVYAIGDIQGCFEPLQRLLDKIQFDPAKDQLWLTGDLVNRGKESLAVLRWAYQWREQLVTVLGNHDLHLLAVAAGVTPLQAEDTFQDILAAPDAKELLHWLRFRPLLHYAPASNYLLVHAGIAPAWDINQTQLLAREVEALLQSPTYPELLRHMYGASPSCWQETLMGWPRYRAIINYFTRLRYLDQQGHMTLRYKGGLSQAPTDYVPWFTALRQLPAETKILFGHWAALQGEASVSNIFALDTGCCWGNCLTAMRLEDHKRYQVNCSTLASHSFDQADNA